MSMNLKQLHENRAVWNDHEHFRYARWSYYYTHKNQPRRTENIKYRAKWWKLYLEAQNKRKWYDKEIQKHTPKITGEGLSIPTASWNPSRRQIANWIIPEIEYAANHGWNGYVTSGYRSYALQVELYERYLRGGNIAARPGSSNHEYYKYPGGAIDVTDYTNFDHALKPGTRLHWGIIIGDYVHFSSSGR